MEHSNNLRMKWESWDRRDEMTGMILSWLTLCALCAMAVDECDLFTYHLSERRNMLQRCY